MKSDTVIGIDLGTTNSEVVVIVEGRPELVPVDGAVIMPSVVAVDEEGGIIVGTKARNQELLFPERTVRSVKRHMGQDMPILMGSRRFTPVEISAMILRRLREAAEAHVGGSCPRAVITVPAYFNDAQRAATKEAGEVAGLTVERIINEPTAAALCYLEERDDTTTKKLMVYDLGGGTFDVSIVEHAEGITEVLASHGDTSLGGDDLDALLVDHLAEIFVKAHGEDPREHTTALARLRRAAEEAKIHLSKETYVKVAEEHLLVIDGVSRHLTHELSRDEYEELIHPLILKTKDSVQQALTDAKVAPGQLDEVLLVGGSTRIPLVSTMLFDWLGHMPRFDVEPELAVAMGAGLQAGRLQGLSIDSILVDVSPYSFGTSYLGVLGGVDYNLCYRPIIRRNTPLPAREAGIFYTVAPGQRVVDVKVFQGEHDDAKHNTKIGSFTVNDLDRDAPANSPIILEMRLDLDGILHVSFVEKHTGLTRSTTITDAFRKLTDDEIAAARRRIDEGWRHEHATMAPVADLADDVTPDDIGYDIGSPDGLEAGGRAAWTSAKALLEKTARIVPGLAAIDAREVGEVAEGLARAMATHDVAEMKHLSEELADIVFYLE